MAVAFQYLTAGLYLLAGVAGGVAFTFDRPRFGRVAVGVLAAGAVAHGIAFSLLHTQQPTPSLPDRVGNNQRGVGSAGHRAPSLVTGNAACRMRT